MQTTRLNRPERFTDFAIGRGTLVAAVRRRENTRWQRARALGIIGTALLHILVLLMARSATVEPMELDDGAAGPPMGDLTAAAGGGSGLTMVAVRPEQPQPVEETQEPEPEPVEVVEPEEIVPIPEPAPATRW